ncbi:hypothetical protein PR003_g5393 [Phytophthora rubi]|uniref:Uncharacterized protein n=1 Tax=Phytophthora rubi TaxID=129364 RepID=A0A6A4G4M8_9STRA|nr:hypothetical protein PR003_g5393 [Phytophthora rubi]
MTKISGLCSYDQCEILHGEEFVVEPLKDRLDLLLAEFKSDDQSYRNKSGVDELHTEHKRPLQDISDRMRVVEEEKKEEKQKEGKSNCAANTR